jgi:hypothetical protein
MFDPTAFENMKVVLEGAVYDLDLTGDIDIIERNDFINTAKLSRKYELSFRPESFNNVTASIVLEAELENLAAELLPGSRLEQKAGCWIRLFFSFDHQDKIVDYEKIQKVVSEIWGSGRKIKQTVYFYPLQNEKMKSEVAIDFGRLIREDQIEDLTEMIEIMITTCEQIQAVIPRR